MSEELQPRSKTEEERSAYQRERDLYRRFLELARHTEIERLLEDALAVVVESLGASQGFAEIRCEDSGGAWWVMHGLPMHAIDDMRSVVTEGSVAITLAEGRASLTSVSRSERVGLWWKQRNETVLCAPIKRDGVRGVVCVQGRHGWGTFSIDEQERAELLANHLGLLVRPLVAGDRTVLDVDPVAHLPTTLRLAGMVGSSPAFVAMLQEVAPLAAADVPVLITGDSGTGKTTLGCLIHHHGSRAGKPLLHVSCAAMPDDLLESELVGVAPSSFRFPRPLLMPAGGTIFLDDASEMSPSGHARLFEILESKAYQQASPAGIVRIIAAMRSPETPAAQRVAEEFVHRLGGAVVRMPSLAERVDDIPAIAAVLCDAAARSARMPWMRLSERAGRAAQAAEWPVNVRHLQRAIAAAIVRAALEGVAEVQVRHLFPFQTGSDRPTTFHEATLRFQTQLLRDTLLETDWNVRETAERLELDESHVARFIDAFGLARAPSSRT